jgi:tRNA(His) 5'-end guanylyltransferase
MANKPRTDSLGDRMKRYEATTRFLLPRRTYTILRVDGRAFHTWTRGLDRPYDRNFMACMNEAALELCQQIAGAQFAYVQSDEISLLAVDFLDIKTEPWFEGGVQKWASVGASIATMAFNNCLLRLKGANLDESELKITKKLPNATFDARVFTIPDLVEVENYFVWRQQDAERNSVTMLAQSYASHKQLMGKNRAAQHEIIHKAGDNWAKHPVRFKHGAVIRRAAENEVWTEVGTHHFNWVVDEDTPAFTKDRAYIRGLVPVVWDNDLLVRKAAANGE